MGFGAFAGYEAWCFFVPEALVLGEVVWEVGVLGAVPLAGLEWFQVPLELGVWDAACLVEELG